VRVFVICNIGTVNAMYRSMTTHTNKGTTMKNESIFRGWFENKELGLRIHRHCGGLFDVYVLTTDCGGYVYDGTVRAKSFRDVIEQRSER
jgi:hypothetical protein